MNDDNISNVQKKNAETDHIFLLNSSHSPQRKHVVRNAFERSARSKLNIKFSI